MSGLFKKKQISKGIFAKNNTKRNFRILFANIMSNYILIDRKIKSISPRTLFINHKTSTYEQHISSENKYLSNTGTKLMVILPVRKKNFGKVLQMKMKLRRMMKIQTIL